MNILIGCEFSGVVRDAFRSRGHNAYSCDLEPNESRYHIQYDILRVLSPWWGMKWDMLIAFPPCTHLCSSGARHFPAKRADGRQQKAIDFVRALADAPVYRIAIENPIGILSTTWRKPDQIIQPWQFGHGETKATCLWLKNLPRLQPTHLPNDLFCAKSPVERHPRIHLMPPSANRGKLRSITYSGIAKAMSEQWG